MGGVASFALYGGSPLLLCLLQVCVIFDKIVNLKNVFKNLHSSSPPTIEDEHGEDGRDRVTKTL